MSDFLLEDLSLARVSPHAIERYRQRRGSKQSDAKVTRKILNMLLTGREVWLKKKFRVVALIDHRMAKARYFQRDEFILVLEGDLIRTLHRGTANRGEGQP